MFQIGFKYAKRKKKLKKNDIENDALNSEESAVETDEVTKDDLGSPNL